MIDDADDPQLRNQLMATASEWAAWRGLPPPRLQQHGDRLPRAAGWRQYLEEVMEPVTQFQLGYWSRILGNFTERGRIVNEAAELYRRLVETSTELLNQARSVERGLKVRDSRDPRERPDEPELMARLVRIQELGQQQADLVSRLCERRHWNDPEDE